MTHCKKRKQLFRPHCEYVLHSSGQLFSHKRKHERKESELAYRKYKMTQSPSSSSFLLLSGTVATMYYRNMFDSCHQTQMQRNQEKSYVTTVFVFANPWESNPFFCYYLDFLFATAVL